MHTVVLEKGTKHESSGHRMTAHLSSLQCNAIKSMEQTRKSVRTRGPAPCVLCCDACLLEGRCFPPLP